MTPPPSPTPPSGPSSNVVGWVGTDRRDRSDQRAPLVFISHGSPLALLDNDFKQALRHFGAHMRPPRAVLVVSAHWQSVRPLRLTGSAKPETIHDFEGFPAWLYSVHYKCPGSPGLAEQVRSRLGEAGLVSMLDPHRGLDSAAWGPLSLIYPNAKVPVVQLSLPAPASPEDILAVGAAVADLRRDGVMLIGSGGLVHNLSRVSFDGRRQQTEAWAIAFDEWMRERIEAFDIDELCKYRVKAPMAHLAAPTSEHLDPLFFVLGARLQGDVASTLVDGFHGGTLSLRSFVFSGRRADDRRLPDRLALGS